MRARVSAAAWFSVSCLLRRSQGPCRSTTTKESSIPCFPRCEGLRGIKVVRSAREKVLWWRRWSSKRSWCVGSGRVQEGWVHGPCCMGGELNRRLDPWPPTSTLT